MIDVRKHLINFRKFEVVFLYVAISVADHVTYFANIFTPFSGVLFVWFMCTSHSDVIV